MRFVDTSFWIAIQYARDRHFEVARQLLRDRQYPLLTTNLALGETWTFLRRREGHRVATGFLDIVEQSTDLVIVQIDDETERAAWAWLRRHDERIYSFVDATSFAVMRKLDIFEALAFDGDFSAAGFVEVRP